MIIKEQIVSPFSDRNAVLKRKKGIKTFRKEEFEITEHYYQCIETGEEFTTDEVDQINLNQVYNQYRDRFGLPFPDQIKRIRDKYEVSAARMSEILGLGANSFRLYEQGEVPSVGNGRLILAAEGPKEFKKFLTTSQEVIGEKEYEKLTRRVNDRIEEANRDIFTSLRIGEIFEKIVPDHETGYRLPSLQKISHMILFFSMKTLTWKTKLNKMFFYSDFLAFKNSGYGISGLDYRAFQMGPVPAKFEEMYNEISRGDIVKREYVEDENYGIYGSIFVPKNIEFDSSLFDEFELSIMEKVSEELKYLTAREVIYKSHKERGWIENKDDKKIISYKDYGFELVEM